MALIRVKARTKGVKDYINCQRGTWFGNPFPVSRYGLTDSLGLYKAYLVWRIDTDVKFQDYLYVLGKKAVKEDVRLGCTCKLSVRCHVDILIKAISNMIYGMTKNEI